MYKTLLLLMPLVLSACGMSSGLLTDFCKGGLCQQAYLMAEKDGLVEKTSWDFHCTGDPAVCKPKSEESKIHQGMLLGGPHTLDDETTVALLGTITENGAVRDPYAIHCSKALCTRLKPSHNTEAFLFVDGVEFLVGYIFWPVEIVKAAIAKFVRDMDDTDNTSKAAGADH